MRLEGFEPPTNGFGSHYAIHCATDALLEINLVNKIHYNRNASNCKDDFCSMNVTLYTYLDFFRSLETNRLLFASDYFSLFI